MNVINFSLTKLPIRVLLEKYNITITMWLQEDSKGFNANTALLDQWGAYMKELLGELKRRKANLGGLPCGRLVYLGISSC